MSAAELPVPKKRRWTLRRITAALALAILVIAIAGYNYGSNNTTRMLTQAVAEADRDDPNWRIQDLFSHRIAIPDSENSGLVAAKAMKGLPWNWPEDPPKPGGLYTPKSEASKVYETIPNRQANLLPPSEFEATLRESLARYEENVRIARKLVDFPKGSYKIALRHNPLEMVLSGSGNARTVARLLYVDAIVRAHEGDADGAIESCIAQINAGRSIGDEPTLASQLIRTSIVHLATRVRLARSRRLERLGRRPWETPGIPRERARGADLSSCPQR